MFNRFFKEYELKQTVNNRNILFVIIIVIIVNLGNHYILHIMWTLFSTLLQIVAVILSLDYIKHKLGEATVEAVASIEAKGYKKYNE